MSADDILFGFAGAYAWRHLLLTLLEIAEACFVLWRHRKTG